MIKQVLTTPVIHNHHAKDVIMGIFHTDGCSQCVTTTYKECHLQLKVHQATWSKHRWLIILRSCLTIWPVNRSARHHYTGGSAMVADWQVLPEIFYRVPIIITASILSSRHLALL